MSKSTRSSPAKPDLVHPRSPVYVHPRSRDLVHPDRPDDHDHDHDPARAQGGAAGIVRISQPSEVDTLARRLLDPARERPVVVVSVPGGRTEPWIDAAAIEHAVRSLAEVVVLANDAASWRLSALLPARTQAYGGAGRVYPVEAGWQSDPYLSPLRFAYGEEDGVAVTELLIHDALAMAARAWAARPVQAPGVPTRRVRGVVGRLVPPSCALVKLDDDGVATVWSELTAPGVPIDRLLVPGQVVTGTLDADARRLDVTEMRRPDLGADAYPDGAVVLAAVASVRPDVVHLALTPERTIPVPKDRVTANPLDRMTSLFSEGEVVLARIAWRDGERLFLRLDDIDDDEEPLPAPTLLAGGPPWLLPPPEACTDDDVAEDPPAAASETGPGAQPVPVEVPSQQRPTPVPQRPTPVPQRPTPRDVVVEKAVAEGAARARVYQERARELESQVVRLEAKVRHQKTALRRATLHSQAGARQRTHRAEGAAGPDFLDRVEQFRHEVHLEWVRRIPAAQKAELPLAPYSLGPEFLDTLSAVKGVERSKVVQVVVEVLTGLADRLDGREKHPLRLSASGGSPAVRRDDGWICWRVALQRETPAARRLHFWQRGKEYELSRVGNHDDFRP